MPREHVDTFGNELPFAHGTSQQMFLYEKLLSVDGLVMLARVLRPRKFRELHAGSIRDLDHFLLSFLNVQLSKFAVLRFARVRPT